MTIRLLALDIDGTLLDSQQSISQRTRNAICALAERRIPVVLVTGRRFISAHAIALELGLRTPLIAHNGALTKDLESLDVIDYRPLPRAYAKEFVRLARTMGRGVVCCDDPYGDGRGVTDAIHDEDGHFSRYLHRGRYQVGRVDDLWTHLDHDPIQMMSLGRYEAMERFAEILTAQMSSVANILRTSYPTRDMTFVDMVDASASKAVALAAVARHLGIAPANVMAVGDNHNDLEMLEYSGVGVLMGNAEEPLKQMGFRTTASNDEDGLAQAIEELVLKR